jgi:small subunit ribosomal protein S20
LADHKSAIKRHRQSLVRRERNRHVKVGMRTLIKRFRSAVSENDASAAAESFAAVEKAIRKAVTKGVVPKTRASRHISRLARSLNGVSGS